MAWSLISEARNNLIIIVVYTLHRIVQCNSLSKSSYYIPDESPLWQLHERVDWMVIQTMLCKDALKCAPLSSGCRLRARNIGNSVRSQVWIFSQFRRDPSRLPCGTLYPQKLALTSLRSGGCSVNIFRSRTQTTEFFPSDILWNNAFTCCSSRP
jgi:hypothetical protein